MNKEEQRKYLKCSICGNRANLIITNNNVFCYNCISLALEKYIAVNKGIKEDQK